jgi:hypothetical protein
MAMIRSFIFYFYYYYFAGRLGKILFGVVLIIIAIYFYFVFLLVGSFKFSYLLSL